ncbi:tRNA pseudouridine(38-40) synthase TruA [Herbiconiux sp. L3-i23]|uniref:tRNA pseudouridine synthase A n=1 Tax=Herbiconiux sp. L3-i23 TaxID=2905871 RepID=UPI0020708E98|nr:tRNA pseudouridine synthase A [Herbiconiux sp. L3-i23]BDI23843.1 tRNA pseudouridine synthase A [Herbiconiux sp. L3-i23]
MSSPVRFRLDIAYDGTGFRGWGKQPGLRTVQGVLDEALATLFRRTTTVPALTVAGRTDAGVHALGQVAHLDLGDEHLAILDRARTPSPAAGRAAALTRRLTGVLGSDSDVVILAGAEAPVGFDARFGAVWRRYQYRIADARARRDPLQRHRTLWYPAELDDERMALASQGLLGLGDFAAYCRPREEATTIRTLQRFDWSRDGDGVLVADLQADAFCHSMVRSLIGAAIAVGEGRLPSDRLAALLGADGRSSEFVVQAAKGLTLMEVGYPPDDQLEARAEQTRARRSLDD